MKIRSLYYHDVATAPLCPRRCECALQIAAMVEEAAKLSAAGEYEAMMAKVDECRFALACRKAWEAKRQSESESRVSAILGGLPCQ